MIFQKTSKLLIPDILSYIAPGDDSHRSFYEKKQKLSYNSLYSNLLNPNNEIFSKCDSILLQPTIFKKDTVHEQFNKIYGKNIIDASGVSRSYGLGFNILKNSQPRPAIVKGFISQFTTKVRIRPLGRSPRCFIDEKST